MPNKPQDTFYTPEQIARIEQDLGKGCVDWIERKARYVRMLEEETVSGATLLTPPGLRARQLRPTRKSLEQALKGVEVLFALLRGGVLNNYAHADWDSLDVLAELRRQLQWNIDEKRYRRAGRRPTPRHTKQLVLELARAWELHHGKWPTRSHDWVAVQDSGPFLEIVRIVFESIRPFGKGLDDLVRIVLSEGPDSDSSARLKWPRI